MNKLEVLVTVLERRLTNERYVTLEALSEQLKESRADIHRAFKILGTKGWSIRPSNHVPYERGFGKGCYGKSTVRTHPIWNRGRKKGERYVHDRAEPYWDRTTFIVTPPRCISP